MRIEKKNERWGGEINHEEYSNILFNNLIVRNTKIKNTLFKNVHFKNCYLGSDSTYTDCKFENCKFFGQYCVLGTASESFSKYDKCQFVNCSFVGLNLLRGLIFTECLISGKIKNVILNDGGINYENWQTVFEKCDLSETLFDNVSIYGRNIFKNTILPKKGLRLYRNPNDALKKRAADICSNINDDSKIESEVIFTKDTRYGQNPIILDEPFINSFFKTAKSKEVFDEIVKGFEIIT